MKLTEKAAQALTSLRGNSEFGVFLTWVAEHRSAAMQECTQHLDHAKTLRAQGKYQSLHDLLTAIEQAPATLEKIRK